VLTNAGRHLQIAEPPAAVSAPRLRMTRKKAAIADHTMKEIGRSICKPRWRLCQRMTA
jgi:hypothetical protein